MNVTTAIWYIFKHTGYLNLVAQNCILWKIILYLNFLTAFYNQIFSKNTLTAFSGHDFSPLILKFYRCPPWWLFIIDKTMFPGDQNFLKLWTNCFKQKLMLFVVEFNHSNHVISLSDNIKLMIVLTRYSCLSNWMYSGCNGCTEWGSTKYETWSIRNQVALST